MRNLETASRRQDIVRVSVARIWEVFDRADGRTTTQAFAAVTVLPAVASLTETLPEHVRTPDKPFGAVDTLVASAAAPISV
jgi:hypothetical protein